MPIYMDRHNLPNVTAQDVAAVHQEDLKVQERYGCRGMTYWFDEKRRTAFCLVEAPDEQAVRDMHDNAHGLMPHKIIEVDAHVVNAFLGRIEDPKPNKEEVSGSFPIIHEPAYRVIMYISLTNSILSQANNGAGLLKKHRDLLDNALCGVNGTIVKKTVDVYLVSFLSVEEAVGCSLEIQRKNKALADAGICLRIGISAGPPFIEGDHLFGESVQLAKRLCEIAQKNQIVVSSEVTQLYREDISYSETEEATLKALSPQNERFLNLLMDTTESIWNEPKMKVSDFGKLLGLSRAQLYRKTMAVTGYSPNDFIKEFRLNKAIKLIERRQGNVADIAFEVGFASPSYFTKCFIKRFGILPSSYVKKVA